MWKISERDKRAEGYNLKYEDGRLIDPFRITSLRVRPLSLVISLFYFIFIFLTEPSLCVPFAAALQVPVLMPMDLMVEASPRRIFANAHTYHINSISVNSDHETYLSADDLRINLWHLEITDRSFSILFATAVEILSRHPGGRWRDYTLLNLEPKSFLESSRLPSTCFCFFLCQLFYCV